MPASYGEIWPEFKPYCGVPVRLAKSMYGMTLSGKTWYVELQEWLLSQGFQQSSIIKCLFWKTFPDGSVIKMLDYVDDLLYFGTSLDTLKAFEEAISKRFDLTLMGQAHWYLATRISQAADFNITVDQSRYCISIVKRYLEKAGFNLFGVDKNRYYLCSEQVSQVYTPTRRKTYACIGTFVALFAG